MNLFVAALLAGASPGAAAPPPPPIAQLAREDLGVSPAGAAIVAAWLREAQASQRRHARALDAVHKSIRKLTIGRHLNVLKFGDLVRREDTLRAEQRAAETQAFLDLLERLTPDDRIALMKVFAPAAGSAPAGAPRR